jgi:chemotaxis protein MotB
LARKRRQPEHENHERWLVSYADFITLLFAFFVVMFASSQTDHARAAQVSESVKEAIEKGGISAAVREVLGGTVDDKGKGNGQLKGPGGSQPRREEEKPVPVELLPAMGYLAEELKNEIAAGKLEINLQPRGLVVSLRQAAYFPSGEDTLNPSTLPSLEKLAATIHKLPNTVRLEGHTDAVPISTARFHSNWELSAARAIAVMERLAKVHQIPRTRMAIAGYADTVPVASNDLEEGKARNRRVDVVIMSQAGYMNEPDAARPRAAEPPQASPHGSAHQKH